jgi:outer membrane protein assembly factor BamD
MKEYNDENYLEAQQQFDLIKLQYPASQYSDDAQFYLAETNYQRKEYIYAAYNYGTLRRTYPQSQYCKRALFNTGLCFYELAPPYDRDQDYIVKTIQSFSEFQTIYGGDSLNARAGEIIDEMRERLARREYEIAQLYRNLYSPLSSVIYYDIVIDNFPDTKYYELAFVGKIECLVEMKKNEQAASVIQSYKKLFPNGINIDKVKSIENSLPNN